MAATEIETISAEEALRNAPDITEFAPKSDDEDMRGKVYGNWLGSAQLGEMSWSSRWTKIGLGSVAAIAAALVSYRVFGKRITGDPKQASLSSRKAV